MQRRARGRVSITAGARVDSAAGETVVAPRVLAAATTRGWTLRASAGTQYDRPPLATLHGLLGNPMLRMPHAFEIDWGVFTVSGEVLNVLNRKNEYNVESTLLTVARTGQYSSGLRKGFPVAPSIGLSVQF